MFEKEAKKWVKEHTEIEYKASYGEFPIEPSAIKSFKAGAEFGYNKANEWHDLRKDPNDLPIFETELLCQKYSGRCFVGYYHYNDNKFYPYEKGNSYDVTDVIAWKEIVLPKESEECTH